MSHSTISTIKNLVISARFNCCRKTRIKLSQSNTQKTKEKTGGMSINFKTKNNTEVTQRCRKYYE